MRVWENKSATWCGTHHPPLNQLTVNPRPLQQPRPPIWLGAGASPDSVDLAARLGLGLMLPTVFGTIEMFRTAVELYETAWERYGRDPADRRIGCCSHCFVHRDDATARRIWEPRYRVYIEWVNELQRTSSGRRGSGMGDFDFEALIANTALCGSPQHVIDRMGTIADALHLDTHILMFDMGGLPDDELFTTIALAGTEVIQGR